MSDKKVVRFPMSRQQRVRNHMGKGYVPCEVSIRWLQFDLRSYVGRGGEFITIRVMTSNEWDERSAVICNALSPNLSAVSRSAAYVQRLIQRWCLGSLAPVC